MNDIPRTEVQVSEGLLSEISAEALRVFGSNLRLSFIAGSHARGNARVTSDVDAFILIDRPERSAETEFATVFRRIHAKNNLKLDHYGEIFDVVTATKLIDYTMTLISCESDLQNMACYQGDCVLSIFRKGDVLLKFLLDHKVFVQGDRELLARLEADAKTFFTAFTMERVQRAKGRLYIPVDVEAYGEYYRWSSLGLEEDLVDSPLGIGLERWFSVSPIGISAGLQLGQHRSFPADIHVCPLASTSPSSRVGHFVRHQCLGVQHRRS